MRIPVLFVTYNRIGYSQKALMSVASNAGVPIELNIWDNGSAQDTVRWLREMDGHKDGVATYWGTDVILAEIVFNTENQGLAKAMNWFFRKYSTQPYVVKVDNDTVLPKNWLKDLLEVMERPLFQAELPAQQVVSGGPVAFGDLQRMKLGAVSPTCLRPSGPTFDEWVRDNMISLPFKDHLLHFNSYVLGTGVLINMDMIRELGLLFEHFPYGPETPHFPDSDDRLLIPEKTCLISGWTAYTRIAADYHGWKFAFYSKVHANLLNLKAEHVLSNDYPEYDEELKDARDQGNKWWESVGGLPGVKKYVEEHGGLEKLVPFHPGIPTDMPDPLIAKVRRYLTDCDDREERSTQQWWEERVKRVGVSRSIFMDQMQARTNEFTERHLRIIRRDLAGLRVLEVGCGWGRMAGDISRVAQSYVGVDFVEQLLATARETFPKLDFRYADAGQLPFPDQAFDAVVAIACVSSFDARMDAVMKEMLRVVTATGFVLLLEEEWSREQWKLEYK